MKCRTFLKNTADLGALVVLLWALSGSHMYAEDRDDDTGNDAIRVGIITRRDGPHLGSYLDSVAACKGVAQVAVADESGSEFERARRALGSAFSEVPTYRSPATMIDEFKPQLVIVTLPAHLSPAAIRLALEAGSHVLTEKPGCVRAEQFAAQRGPAVSAESFQWYSTHAKAPKGVRTENPTSKIGGYQSLVQAAVDGVRGVRPAPLTGEDSLQVLKVIFAAYRASETGTVQNVQ